ncbi:MAG: RagB/SusD family nutrient uptake outer membrane protein [Bacteroidales bacterium]|nr:RagB/SusD family nutrient uptake outer membrane protein [Bacteroidales bacterium]
MFTILCFWLVSFNSCSDFLGLIPDNVATIEHVFAMRSEAEKFLFTCYSYMPKDGNPGQDPAMEGGDEIWRLNNQGSQFFNIARGYQNVSSPYGDNLWVSMYRALRDCNIFLQNIEQVPDMSDIEKSQWIAEVKTLKAYYHFYLVRMYGPVPLIKENLPIDAGVEEVKLFRQPVDSCFNYIVRLIDEAVKNLPLNILNKQNESGRITQTIALSFKAKVLVTAASPLFNGNEDQAALKNPDGTQLFNQSYSQEKWKIAAVACKKAIDWCDSVAIKLYIHESRYQQFKLTDTIQHQLSFRNAVCKRWNDEVIWANTQSYCAIQASAMPLMDARYIENHTIRGDYSPTLKIVEQFYSRNGVPIDEDKTWDYNNRYTLRESTDQESLHVRKGYTTVNLHFDREPRFYASIGFDGGIWYGQGVYDNTKSDELFYVQTKRGQRNAAGSDRSTVTGYFIKKLIHFENVVGSGTTYSVNGYPWPMIRLSDLYLLYAEAVNELEGPGEEVYKYINLVRERAGLPKVEDAWTQYSNSPDKYKSQDGLREIIRKERLNELAFEGQRFWDLRRWKEATTILNNPVQGWDRLQETAAAYYRKVTLFDQSFGAKDYFWPIKDENITVNRNLVQNLGW